ncbi:chemotaxis protein [Clostridium botulinum]|uniref:Chemotaxis protein n=1 Tax=Clostridium botulinum TaxID=1491 RepID=A0A0L9YB70_CLOBO|nr:methyl-accepting chemotaxis protein [Clostridium botulinum]KAI3350704.1 methyl-accepting chemotaxis protein [Clostridium botulinum]KOM88709.1 chemotaxis protein [Clostridium botulinum]KOR57545.1 chemotaxis protein [Clostridium botulinum]MCS6109739.1 chemotaxis protein [Clostridium botulinum]NFE13188.1 chemotaxis protein [Clostridium botulinum]
MLKKDFENDALNSVCNVIPYIDTFFDNDIEIMVTDREKVLYYQGSKEIDCKIQEGSEAGKFVKEAMSRGKIEVKVIPEDFIGVAFKSYMIPIKEGNKIVGSIAIGKSLSKKNAVTDITGELISTVSNLSKGINNISLNIKNLTNMNNEILEETNNANVMANDTDEIVNFIKSVSSQTNLLGLNASIEAARSGEQGKGFNVVAQEIRKLSHSSKESIDKIESVIENISGAIEKINDKVENVDIVSNKQSEEITEIATLIDKLNNTARLLGDLADKL